MNDVASTSLVRVARPTGLLPVDFSTALADLQTMGFVRIGTVSREDAFVEVLKRAEEDIDSRSAIARVDALGTPAAVSPPAPRTLRGREEKRMSKSRVEEVYELVASGHAKSRDIAVKLDCSRVQVGRYLQDLIASGRVAHTGTRTSSRFYVAGKVPATAEAEKREGGGQASCPDEARGAPEAACRRPHALRSWLLASARRDRRGRGLRDRGRRRGARARAREAMT